MPTIATIHSESTEQSINIVLNMVLVDSVHCSSAVATRHDPATPTNNKQTLTLHISHVHILRFEE